MKLINADCIEAMKAMPDNSVDSIVTDPPYELGFMGKSWDASGIAFNIEVWQEALRVIKPGGHLIAFSGSRTYHRMAVAIEDAGFQIRDQIMWVYGSGFPKSHNISKGIDKAAGAEREVIGQEKNFGASKASEGKQAFGDYAGEWNLTAPNTKETQQWDGWGTALKPAHEPMVLARKPLEGTVANNVLTFGTGGLNIDGSRVGTTVETWPASRSYAPGQLQPGGKGETQATGDVPAGRFPANFIHDGSDEVVALFPDTNKGTARTGKVGGQNGLYENGHDPDHIGTWYGDSGSAARFFYCAKASKRDRNEGLEGFEAKRDHDGRKDGGVGGDNPRNRTNNAKLNHHPTVKPTSLMQYLVRLVTPPNGIVLDPFMGSGSTGKACAYEGFKFIGIDQSAEYVAIAQARIDFAINDKLPL
jgi:site-specific DNA-methyltransferase (adenine-specific)